MKRILVLQNIELDFERPLKFGMLPLLGLREALIVDKEQHEWTAGYKCHIN